MWNHNQKIRDTRETGKGEKWQEGEDCMIKRDNFLSKVYRTMCSSPWDTAEKAINIQYKKNK